MARSMSVATRGSPGKKPFQYDNEWQYHPRSDRHSKIACWAVMFDLLGQCELLRTHLSAGKVAIGINHGMRDFAQNRAKNLDLVISRAQQGERGKRTFVDLVGAYTLILDDMEREQLAAYPCAPLAKPATVLVALEAKACMTAYSKARPRLFDELNSSHLTIHGDTNGAIAAGLALVNSASTFVSPLMNPWPLGQHETRVTSHHQPGDLASVIRKLTELPRRSKADDDGFDALAVAVLDCANDGRPVTVDPIARSVVPSIYDYEQTIGRLAHLYSTRFSGL